MATRSESPASAPEPRQVGETLAGTYRLIRRIGAGGMADVFEVEHLRLGSRFAAKVLRATAYDDPTARRFLREARLLASLKSDHIVTVFDLAGRDEPIPYYVMERLEGADLRQILRGCERLSATRAAKLVLDACRGVMVAHGAGIVHRDLKPENLFVTHRDTGEEVVKLLDFGVVKADGGTSTQHGALVGTLRYMAPEQLEHAGVVGPRSDVRSLGAILYECLAGRPAFQADSFERLAFKILNESPEPLAEVRPELPPALVVAVQKALERDPGRRFPSAQAFAEALVPFAREAGESASVSTEVSLGANIPPQHGPARRIAALVALAGVIGAFAWTVGSRTGPAAGAAPPTPALQPSVLPLTSPSPPPLRTAPAPPAVPDRAAASPDQPARVGSPSAARSAPSAARPKPLPVASASASPAPARRAMPIDPRNPYDDP